MKARQAKKILYDFLKGFNIVPSDSTLIIKSNGISHDDAIQLRKLLPNTVNIIIVDKETEIIIQENAKKLH